MAQETIDDEAAGQSIAQTDATRIAARAAHVLPMADVRDRRRGGRLGGRADHRLFLPHAAAGAAVGRPRADRKIFRKTKPGWSRSTIRFGSRGTASTAQTGVFVR